MTILRQFEKFGSRLKKGFTDFDVKAGKGLAQAGRFIEQKALPVIQKVAGGIAKVASIAAPILLASGVGAEFAPLALGIAAGAGAAHGGELPRSRRDGDTAGDHAAGKDNPLITVDSRHATGTTTSHGTTRATSNRGTST